MDLKLRFVFPALTTVIALSLAASPAMARDELYGIVHAGVDGLSTLYRLDSNTGSARMIGPVGFERCGAMDFDAGGQLYAACERPTTDVPVLITIDLRTGAGTEIGPTGVSGNISDISFRSDGVLFAYEAAVPTHLLHTLNTTTGLASLVGNVGFAFDGGNSLSFTGGDNLLHTNSNGPNINILGQEADGGGGIGVVLVGTLIFPSGLITPRFSAMDRNPTTGVQWGTVKSDFGPGATSYLATLDPTTRQATLVGVSITNLDAVAWFSNRVNTLYGTTHIGPNGPSTLHRIDPGTGIATPIGPIGFERCGAMDFDPQGRLYATCERLGTSLPVLVRINLRTGAGTEVGPTGIAGSVSDISFRDDGVLFAFNAANDPEHTLVRLSTATGVASLVGDTGLSADSGNSLVFDRDGRLIHTASVLPGLNVLNQTTGVATLTDTLTFPPSLAAPRFAAMDLNKATGELWGTVKAGFGASVPAYLATMSSDTGAVRVIGESVVGLDAVAWLSTRFTNGPDVTIWDLDTNFGNQGSLGGLRAYSIGTDSCNVGTAVLNWCDNPGGCPDVALDDDQHPVISQNLYRLENGRFEQLGQSWLKHGFLATNTTSPACSGHDGAGNETLCLNPGSGNILGVGCTDFYSTGLNGNRPLGLRSEVNPATGQFPFPFTQIAFSTDVDQRLQVLESDINPASRPTALFFAEGQYVADNDALTNNGLNNASYLKVAVDGGTYDLVEVGTTVREASALYAWRTEDPAVEIVNVDVPGAIVERFEVARRITHLGAGNYRTVIAIRNMNSERAARGLRVRFPNDQVISNAGFHDVDSHSGEAYATTDWTIQISGDVIRWFTLPFSQDPMANALRWGTTYTFWFDSNTDPRGADYELELFKGPTPRLPIRLLPLPLDFIFADGFEVGGTLRWN